MSEPIDFFFEFRSPYSYLALSQVDKLGLPVNLKPINVVTLMGRVGNSPTSVLCPPKGAYLLKDLARWSARYGLPITGAAMRQINPDQCLRAVVAADGQAEMRKVAEALFHACWGAGKSLETKELILSVLEEAGIATDAIAARMDDDAVAAQVDANTEEAIARGVFGIPTMFIGDTMFFGNDRFDFMREHLGLEKAA